MVRVFLHVFLPVVVDSCQDLIALEDICQIKYEQQSVGPLRHLHRETDFRHPSWQRRGSSESVRCRAAPVTNMGLRVAVYEVLLERFFSARYQLVKRQSPVRYAD